MFFPRGREMVHRCPQRYNSDQKRQKCGLKAEYMARGITVPIQQLAEGTRRIAEGDLTFRIGVRATDEIALLVDSFNTMTKELNESRINIQQVNQNLKQTNIELDRRRNYIETILDNIGAGVISIDKKAKITTINKAFKALRAYVYNVSKAKLHKCEMIVLDKYMKD